MENFNSSPVRGTYAGNPNVGPSEIAAKLEKGANPLDFIQKNIAKSVQPHPNTPYENMSAAVDQLAHNSITVAEHTRPDEKARPTTTPSIIPEVTFDDSNPAEPAKQSTEIKEPSTVEPVDLSETPAEESVEEGAIEINFKKLRTTHKEVKTLLKQKEEELAALSEKVKRYDTGEVLPEVLAQKDAEIEKLKKYQRIVDVKGTEEYHDTYVKPLTGIREKLKTIGADYDLPEGYIEQALEFDNQAELNRFLSSHFDDIGGLEVKQLVNQAKDLKKGMQEAEKEPETVLQKLQSDGQKARQAKLQSKKATMANTVRTSWQKSMDRIKSEGKAHELIYKDGDVEHNTKFVDPVVKAAATEYGKLVTKLVESGLENLSDDTADALAMAVLLAHASAISIDTREAAINHANGVVKNAQRTNSYVRPLTRGSAVASNSVEAPKATSPMDAARQITAGVLGRR